MPMTVFLWPPRILQRARRAFSGVYTPEKEIPELLASIYLPWPNGFELTGAGLTPRCNDERREAGVRCSEGLDDAFIC